jgi:hypothetical protein
MTICGSKLSGSAAIGKTKSLSLPSFFEQAAKTDMININDNIRETDFFSIGVTHFVLAEHMGTVLMCPK